MKTIKSPILILFATLLCAVTTGQDYLKASDQDKPEFQWPEGKKMALSLTFDDARLSQIDTGIPLLDKHGVKATFYISISNMIQRLDGWKQAIKNGHDIGNHSLLHPCTINYGWPQEAALENYTLQRMTTELDSASAMINNILGIMPNSFAFPCGQTFVGRGVNLKSYVPLVASMFESGRLWLSEGPNDPVFCDMAQLTGMELDGKSFGQIKSLIESAANKGQWLILAGHEMDEQGHQTSQLEAIEAICEYASDPANGIWIDNVHNIAAYIRSKRGQDE